MNKLPTKITPGGIEFATSSSSISPSISPLPPVASSVVETSPTNSTSIQDSLISSPSSTPTSSPTPANTDKEKYKNGEYPMSKCGEFSGYPVYPIFVSGGLSSFEMSKNFEKVTKEFCQDAIEVKGRIRVASFSDEKEADMFLEFIKEYFDRAWKGQAIVRIR